VANAWYDGAAGRGTRHGAAAPGQLSHGLSRDSNGSKSSSDHHDDPLPPTYSPLPVEQEPSLDTNDTPWQSMTKKLSSSLASWNSESESESNPYNYDIAKSQPR
jgi:hypothetical protein